MEVLWQVVMTAGYILSTSLFTIFIIVLSCFLKSKDQKLDGYMLWTLAMIGLSEYIQVYTYCCEHYGRPDLSLSTSLYAELIIHLVFFFGQLIYLTRLILVLLTFNSQETFPAKARLTKLSMVAVALIILALDVAA